MENKISIKDVIQLIGGILALVGLWIAMEVRVTKLETSHHLEVREMQKDIEELKIKIGKLED